MKTPPRVKRILRSFRFAGRGLREVVRTEPNFRIHLAVALAVAVAGIALGIAPLEWCALVLAIALVLVAETLNTAIEYFCDAVHPERSEQVRRAKDAAAGAVLIATLAAAALGAIVFAPRLWAILQKTLQSPG